MLLWPVTDANFENASYHQFAEGHFLTRNMMKWFWDNYTPDPKQRQDDLCLAPAGDDRTAQGPAARPGPDGGNGRAAR